MSKKTSLPIQKETAESQGRFVQKLGQIIQYSYKDARELDDSISQTSWLSKMNVTSRLELCKLVQSKHVTYDEKFCFIFITVLFSGF